AVLENADKAIRLSPNDPLMWLFLLYRAHGYEFIGDFDRAIECFEQSSRFARVGHWAFSKLAAAYYEVGRKEEAAAAFEQARLIEPNLSLEGQRKALRFIQHDKFDYYLRNLHALGLK
ncbi:MAG: tetratricopeptide repeat protein, partial [Gammaproteobacteria bacterium]|nr:tetratricopeptide repeat protein [Gammaproteobacteria bacterium]